MCHGYHVRSVFFTYACPYAFSRMLMIPSTPSCIVKGNAIVAIGVDQRGDGRDNRGRCRRSRSPEVWSPRIFEVVLTP